MVTEKRKRDHIRVCLTEDVQFLKSNGFEDYDFTHSAAPELEWDEIDIKTRFLGKEFRAPFFIEAMTGGTKEAERINRNLAKAAQDLGIGMGVGSQRAMIENPELASTYAVKESSPNVFLVGNIGASHVTRLNVRPLREALEQIKADALAIHLNPAQEIAQEGGHHKWRGVLSAIRKIRSEVGVPVIVKEVGCGISGDVARRLARVGVGAIDIAGAGGTSWIKIDSIISKRPYDKFFEWGIPTAESLEQCARSVRIPLIASGGIRSGIEAAKALSMGATLVGTALPLLRPATESADAVKSVLSQFVLELKTAMFLTSSANLQALKGKAVKI
jgi:isopentenyl-diphosphate delta-isomerase